MTCFRGTLTDLTRPCSEVIFDHPYFEDIGGMAYHRCYCDWLVAADIAVQSFYTVQAQRSRNPKPSLWENSGHLILFHSKPLHFTFSNFKITWAPAGSHFSFIAEQCLITSHLHILPHTEIQAHHGNLVRLTGSSIHKHEWFHS